MAQPQPIAATPTPSPAPDAALIAAWRGGGRAGGGRAGAAARAGAGAVSRRRRAPEADLDDLVQEALIRAFRAVDRFRSQCQFRTWLLTIGGNVLKDHGRRAGRHKVVALDDRLPAREGNPHERAEAGEAEERLTVGVAALPRLQREVFLLRAQQGLAYAEIAAALDTTEGAARVHYHHAVKRLKELLQ